MFSTMCAFLLPMMMRSGLFRSEKDTCMHKMNLGIWIVDSTRRLPCCMLNSAVGALDPPSRRTKEHDSVPDSTKHSSDRVWN